jgi:hypothetical protein
MCACAKCMCKARSHACRGESVRGTNRCTQHIAVLRCTAKMGVDQLQLLNSVMTALEM